ncbi:NUMOD4 motif-containing HNH endonuclease [Delftia acidovorans]
MTEQWKPIAGYEGFYEISTLGRVRSLPRIDSIGRARKGRMKATPIDRTSTGYRFARLSKDGIAKKLVVHVLVLETFVGPRPSPAMEACHGDGDRANPVLSNLRWDTAKGNAADKRRHGTNMEGEKAPVAVLTNAMVRQILDSQLSSLKLAPLLGVASSTVRAVRLGQNWSHLTGRGARAAATPTLE